MKIAIHEANGSYSDYWLFYCKSHQIIYKVVDCYRNDIIQQLTDCNALMWHYHHKDSRDVLLANQLLSAVESAGKNVYPDFNTRWFFDDKVGQKYLLEAINAPLIPSHVFLSKKEALKWIDNTSFPKVFKLRRGSGSANVRLVRTRKEAKALVRQAFGSGFRQYNPVGGLIERWRLFRLGTSDLMDLLEGVGRFAIKTRFERIVGKERGYVYFQDFVDGCTFDIRTTVIGEKCYAIKRFVRKNDFRASGSHDESCSPEEIPIEVVQLSFQISEKLKLQSVAFDFLITKENKPLIAEMSYAFGWDETDAKVYWDRDLNYHSEPFNPFGEMIENLIRQTEVKGRMG